MDKNIAKRLNALTLGDRLSHAVLISGGSPELRAKAAFYLAGFTVCTAACGKPCGECEACRKSSDRVHPDIYFFEKPSDKRFFVKKAVRDLCEDVYLTPNESDVKVVIISELQNMNEECQNLLLRVLEEPPHYSSFVLTVSSKNVLLPTVLSRVTKLDLGEGNVERAADPKVMKIAKAVAGAILSPDEFDIIKASSEIEGDKQIYIDVLYELSLIFRDALVKSMNAGDAIGFADEAAADLASVLSKKQLMNLYDTVSELLAQADINKNKALMLTSLSTRLRQAVQL